MSYLRQTHSIFTRSVEFHLTNLIKCILILSSFAVSYNGWALLLSLIILHLNLYCYVSPTQIVYECNTCDLARFKYDVLEPHLISIDPVVLDTIVSEHDAFHHIVYWQVSCGTHRIWSYLYLYYSIFAFVECIIASRQIRPYFIVPCLSV